MNFLRDLKEYDKDNIPVSVKKTTFSIYYLTLTLVFYCD